MYTYVKDLIVDEKKNEIENGMFFNLVNVIKKEF